MKNTYILKIYRGSPGKQYWEEFELPLRPNENVISGLMEIAKKPINREGKKVTPVVWESGCLEEVCGSCSMLINGKPRQACTALIQDYIDKTKSRTIVLAPFTKFPLVRDLIVDRSLMFDNLKKIHGWIDDEKKEGYGPKIAPERQEVMYTLSTCMTCGCCSESCPQVNEKSDFIGPAPISQVHLFNMNPTGKKKKRERLHALMQKGGVSECGNAQNCVKVCPKNIPLTDSISHMGRDVSIQALKDIFHLDKDEKN